MIKILAIRHINSCFWRSKLRPFNFEKDWDNSRAPYEIQTLLKVTCLLFVFNNLIWIDCYHLLIIMFLIKKKRFNRCLSIELRNWSRLPEGYPGQPYIVLTDFRERNMILQANDTFSEDTNIFTHKPNYRNV